jgi:hypothetical protein
MIDSRQLRQAIAQRFLLNSVSRNQKVWRLETEELLWLVELDRRPYGARFALDLGVHVKSLHLLGEAERPGNCLIEPILDRLPLGEWVDEITLARAFDLGSTLDDQSRLAALDATVDGLCSYMASTQTVEDLITRYRRGDLKGAAIVGEASELFRGLED